MNINEILPAAKYSEGQIAFFIEVITERKGRASLHLTENETLFFNRDGNIGKMQLGDEIRTFDLNLGKEIT